LNHFDGHNGYIQTYRLIFMPCEYVEFSIIPPIREDIGELPENIKLIKKDDLITGLQVTIGEERTEKIKNSDHFKKNLAESEKKHGIEELPTDSAKITEKSRHKINFLKKELGDYATHKAETFINKLNFKLDSPSYCVQIERLAYLKFTVYIRYGAGGYVKSDSKMDIIDIIDEDNLLERMTNSYVKGMTAQNNGDLVSAYKWFYLVYPDKPKITGDEKKDFDLRILRDAVSHLELTHKNLMERAKDLLGEEYVKTKDGKTYAYADLTVQKHKELYQQNVPILRKHAKEYIENYFRFKR